MKSNWIFYLGVIEQKCRRTIVGHFKWFDAAQEF